jgi:thioesterase domain-containing protein
MRRTGSRDPIFLVHCGGGHVLRYEDLLATLPEDQPVYGLSAPPLVGAEDGVSVESLARLYVDEIRKVRPRGPYQIGGYSFGGLVAYEMARLLAEAGESVPLVAIFDTLNRAAFKSRSLASRAMFNAAYVADRLDRYRSKLASGNFKGFAESAAWAVRRRLGGVRPRAQQNADAVALKSAPDLPADNLALFDALGDRYAPRPFAGNVLVFHAEERGAEYRATPMLGWDAVAANVEVAFVPGDHMTFIKKPNVGSLVAQLQAFQERARAPAGAANARPPEDRHTRVCPS